FPSPIPSPAVRDKVAANLPLVAVTPTTVPVTAMTSSRILTLFTLLASLFATPVLAQKALQDPRPMTRPQNDNIPRYESVEAFLARPGAIPIVETMTPVGKAVLEPFAANARSANVEVIAGKTVPADALPMLRLAEN